MAHPATIGLNTLVRFLHACGGPLRLQIRLGSDRVVARPAASVTAGWRLAALGLSLLAGMFPLATTQLGWAQDPATRVKSENFLPSTTRAWVSIASLTDLEGALYETKMGHLAQDPDLAPVVESFSSQITDWLDNRNVKFALNMDSLGKLNSG